MRGNERAHDFTRSAPVKRNASKVIGRNSAKKTPPAEIEASGPPAADDIGALKKRIVELEAENERLRGQLSALIDRVSAPSQSSEESVRQQRYNFFKYSNVRRY